MGLTNINKLWFWPTIILYVLLGVYLIFTSYSEPYLGIELEEVNNQWIINDLDENFQQINSLSNGDIVLSIDNIPPQSISRLQDDQLIRGASEIVIKKPNNKELTIKFNHFDVPKNFYTLFLFPLIYFSIVLIVTIYLNFKKNNISQERVLIFFILSVSLSYISLGASAKTNIIGLVVNSSFMILSLVLLISFLKRYFGFLNIKWPFSKYTEFLYFLPLIAALFRVIWLYGLGIILLCNILILILFTFLILYIFYILISSYFKYHLPQIKWLFISLIFPLTPFIFLYAIPYILVNEPILYADICSLFLLLIPFNILFFQLSERLFNFIYNITRFRYYFYLSLLFTFWIAIVTYLVIEISIFKLSILSILIFLSSIFSLYLKEKIDYSGKKVLFTAKGDKIKKLSNTIDKIFNSHKVEQMLAILALEIKSFLDVKDVKVVTYCYETNSIIDSVVGVSEPELTSLHHLELGEIIKNGNIYIAFVHQDKDYKRWLFISHHHKSIRLKEDELLWLELLLTYTYSFIENNKRIEHLVDELNQYQRANVNEPLWLKKLVWNRVDEEKYQFAQELHDTVLQEHIQIARQLDNLKYDKEYLNLEFKLKSLHEQMITSINFLRSYCETLKPPLLTNVGLNAALERLFEQTENRAEFKLVTKLNRLYLEDEQLPLVIYRIIQELLNNTIKHSQADKVEVYLQELDNGFELIYRDNGIGCDTSELMNGKSMGLQGITERVEAFNGCMDIQSNPNEGISIKITITERSDNFDFVTDSR